MSIAWLAYLPVPALAVVPALVQPQDRLVRFHSWQGGILVAILWVLLILLGLLTRASDARGLQLVVGAITLVVLVGYLVAALVGGISAARDRYVRIRPVYDLLSAVRT